MTVKGYTTLPLNQVKAQSFTCRKNEQTNERMNEWTSGRGLTNFLLNKCNFYSEGVRYTAAHSVFTKEGGENQITSLFFNIDKL